MNTKTLLKIVVIAAFAAMVLPTLAMAQTDMTVSYQWGAPSTGSTVDHYVVQHKVNNGSWTTAGITDTTSYTLALSVGDSHQIRVAAVDVEDRQGIWSVASDAHTPDSGAPGQPGKPIIF
jgi:hypothetical protein